jgi:hypothetical protein
MRKLFFILTLLIITAPSLADIVITAEVVDSNLVEEDPNLRYVEVEISYDANGEGEIRAFALVISAWCMESPPCPSALSTTHSIDPNVKIDNVWRLPQQDHPYYVTPGSVSITDGEIGDLGNVAVEGVGTDQITVEMASLYTPDENEPPSAGTLIRLRLIGPDYYKMCIESIVTEPVRGDIVFTDVTSTDAIDVNLTNACYEPDSSCGATCWDNVNQCAGQPEGDATCDGTVNIDDLRALKGAWLTNKGDAGYNCCADFTQDNKVNIDDLRALKGGWFNTGYSPSTGNLNCPG